ncbi:MAG TPA: UvrD-helicase domain-containing protein, partial [Mycobacteriales bacterium]|nr:UvrD-helicase domain-containing protein [Mycobacteriales bacterium]
MSETTLASEIAHEQEHVDKVYDRLAIMEEQADLLAAEGHARARIEDAPGLKFDHHRRMFERDVLVHAAAKRRASINAEYGGLVFGRMDRKGGLVDYVGRLGVLDEEYEPLVMDWRAPAAAVFYRATAIDPQGVIRRRVLQSLGARVTGVEDDLLDPESAPEDMAVIGDGALMGALSRARTGTMRDIVSTIQHEQDEAIRAPARGATLITGGPGTGKTVVALHRAAYLLYSDRRRFEGGGVLIIGPSAGFMRYIERVLPSLGEQSVTLRSLGEVLDAVNAYTHDAPAVAAIKGSTRMIRILRRAAADAEPGAPRQFRIFFGGEVLQLDGDALDDIRQRVLQDGIPRNRARRKASRALVAALWRAGSGQGNRREFDEMIVDRDEFIDFLDTWWRPLEPAQVLSWLGEPARLRRYARGILSDAEIATLAAGWAPSPSIEDVPLLDELRIRLGSEPRREDSGDGEPQLFAEKQYTARRSAIRAENYDEYAHVLVDEAQDVTPMQWRMLGRRAQYASWTIVGDAAQSSWPDPAEALAAMHKALDGQAQHSFHLTTNYRNSAEIFDFAGRFIAATVPDADIPSAVRKTGVEPGHRFVAGEQLQPAIDSAIAELLEAVEGTVGVITLEPFESDDERVSVVDPLACKGLEYDGVLIVEPDRIIADSP